ncbi:hypothetical protein NA56DRAFT_712493 [Hyaloscypha hepaticicola]|uniref:Uncharacterized protein n=1 Tax=Hyaloscypha hepaticicola TaxID=2082293 RepID=A0A2J6PG60_9HELO|nr:hypothetical protein NA56DRAFT_712493 [Hyaloscypha hepaticicola]
MTLLGSDTRWGNDLVVPGPKFDGKALTLGGFHLETIREVGEEMAHYAPGTPEFTRTGACDQGVVSYKFSVFKLWYAKYGSNRLRELDETYFEKIDTMEEWGSPRLVTEGQIQHYESKMKEICLGRKFFTTAEDHSSFGLVGSCCVYALGVLKQYNNGELEGPQERNDPRKTPSEVSKTLQPSG